MKIDVIICAAGKGERAGFGGNKLLQPFNGANALYYTIKTVKSFAEKAAQNGYGVGEILVTYSPCDREEIYALCTPLGCRAVVGGRTRTESVYNALKEASGDIVLIHDGARPYATAEQFAACLEDAITYGSAICAMPVTDTIAVVKDRSIADIPKRNGLFTVQTPQAFKTEELKAAYEKAMKSGDVFTDDGSVYSRYIAPAHVCDCGSAGNKKLTFKEDFFPLGDGFMQIVRPAITGGKVGFGADVHAFGRKSDFVILCGVKIPCDSGLVAHSDGDVAVHAVMDALLSAAGLNDIGHYFPDSDDRYKDADSCAMLEIVVSLLKEKGYRPTGLSVAIQAEKPRLARHIEDMKNNLALHTGVEKNSISVAAGTCEKLGFVGEGLGICAYCSAVIQKEEEN